MKFLLYRFAASVLTLTLLAASTPAQTPGATPAPSDPFLKSSDTLITREFKVRAALISRMAGASSSPVGFLKELGVSFPSEASATYIPTSQRLIVRNTQQNLDLIEALIKADGSTMTYCVLVFELYALNKEDALTIIESEVSSAGRYRRILELTKSGRARLDTLTGLPARSGQRAIAESIDEVRYPKEFDRAYTNGAPPRASNFETRNVGNTLEVEPTIGSDGRTIELAIVPRRTTLAGFRDIAGSPGDSLVSQPGFLSQSLTTNTRFPAGEPHYLGTMSPRTGQGIANGGSASKVGMAFIHAHLPVLAGYQEKTPTVEPTPAKPILTVNLEYSFYSTDRAAARDILLGMSDTDVAWKKLLALIGEKRARFEHITTVRSSSGQRCIGEEVEEISYPTQFAPPDLIRKVDTTKRYAGPESIASKSSITEMTTLEHLEGGPGYPNTFETRNTGVTIEVEPTIGPDGTLVDISHVPQAVTYLGSLKVSGAGAQMPEQPLFETRKITSNLVAVMGRHTFIGTFNPPHANGVNDRQDDGRTWLGFVRCISEP